MTLERFRLGVVPAVNSATAWSALACQQTVPEWKVWLLAMMETDLIFSPAGAKSNFQLIVPDGEPSVRAKYTWEETPGSAEIGTSVCLSGVAQMVEQVGGSSPAPSETVVSSRTASSECD